MKKYTIAANWKMNKSLPEAISYAKEIGKHLKTANDIILFPPYPFIQQVRELLKNTSVILGAQNCHQEESGAFTGEVSAQMIRSVGCEMVLLGHSERRQFFKETDEIINKKLKEALKNDLSVMLCVGESDAQRKSGATETVLASQIGKCLAGIAEKEMKRVMIAYEPIWAIGTGKIATPAQAQESHSFIRGEISGLFNENTAKKTRILYGGSVSAQNAASLLREKDVDGALVGKSSLDVRKFLEIVNTT